LTARTHDLDLTVLEPKQFEELVYDLMRAEGFQNLEWRDGGADGGRDITANTEETDGSGFRETRTWFCDAKRYSEGISFDDIHSTLAKATAHPVDYLLFAVWPHLTPPCKDALDTWIEGNKPHFRIRRWEKKYIEEILFKHTDILKKYMPNAWSQSLEMDAYLREATTVFRDFQSRVSVVWKNPDARPFTDLLRFTPKGDQESVTAIDKSQRVTDTERTFLTALLDARSALDAVLATALNVPEPTVFMPGQWSDHPGVKLLILIPQAHLASVEFRDALGRVLGLFERAENEGAERGVLTGASSWVPFGDTDRVSVYALFTNRMSASTED